MPRPQDWARAPRRKKSKPAAAELPQVDIVQAMIERDLLGAGFGDPKTWQQWRIVLRATFGLKLSQEEAEAFAAIAGGRQPPAQRVKELWCVLGRRSGKSRVAAALAVYFATLVDHTGKLAPGEIGFVYVLAASKDQARTIKNYCEGFLRASPVLKDAIEEITAEEIRLHGGIVIGVHSANYRTVRGRSLLAVIFDEVSFWRSEESAQPDVEVYRAVMPALATTGGMLVAISSPYRRIGLLHTKHRDYYGKDHGTVLVIQGESRQFNPTLDDEVIQRAREEDPQAAIAEWDGLFRTDLSQFLDDEVIDAAIDYGRPLELPPRENLTYAGFGDPSGGRHDAFCFAIGHRENDRIIVDVIRGRRPPFDPMTVAAEFSALAKEYRIGKIVSDAYAGEFAAAAFKAGGVEHGRCDLAKSQLYLESLPYWMRGAISIPNVPILIRELRLLERRVTRSGKDSVDHGASGSDDHANVLAGLIWLLRDGARKQHIPIAAPFVATGADYYRSFYTGGHVPSGAFDLGGSYAQPGGAPNPINQQRRENSDGQNHR
jgi:hypothetical protein